MRRYHFDKEAEKNVCRFQMNVVVVELEAETAEDNSRVL